MQNLLVAERHNRGPDIEQQQHFRSTYARKGWNQLEHAQSFLWCDLPFIHFWFVEASGFVSCVVQRGFAGNKSLKSLLTPIVMFLVMLLGGSAFELDEHHGFSPYLGSFRLRHWLHDYGHCSYDRYVGDTLCRRCLCVSWREYRSQIFIFSKFLGRQTIDLTFNKWKFAGKEKTPGHFLVSFEVRPTFPKHFVLTLNCEMTGSPTFKNCSGSFLQLGKSGSAPRYLKEHVAVALGIIAVLVVAIVALSKSFGPENLQRKRKEQILKWLNTWVWLTNN